jgi:hypothetical protein
MNHSTSEAALKNTGNFEEKEAEKNTSNMKIAVSQDILLEQSNLPQKEISEVVDTFIVTANVNCTTHAVISTALSGIPAYSDWFKKIQGSSQFNGLSAVNLMPSILLDYARCDSRHSPQRASNDPPPVLSILPSELSRRLSCFSISVKVEIL